MGSPQHQFAQAQAQSVEPAATATAMTMTTRVRKTDIGNAWQVVGALLAHGALALPDQMTREWLDDLSVTVIVVAQQLAELR